MSWEHWKFKCCTTKHDYMPAIIDLVSIFLRLKIIQKQIETFKDL